MDDLKTSESILDEGKEISHVEIPEELAQEMLEMSGENALEDIVELTMREAGIRSISAVCPRLVKLEVLSLSHNRLQDLEGFASLKQLRHLNLNNNNVASFRGIEECKLLEKLYCSNNKIRNLEPLASCPNLRTIGLFRNALANLDAALATLRTLADLRCLELNGNPCSFSQEYKHRLVTELSLEELDGEPVTELDRELAAMYLTSHAREPSAMARPMTAPAQGGARGLSLATPPRASQRGRSPRLPAVSSRPPSSPSTAAAARLFRDDYLNDNPVLLEYLSNGVSLGGASAPLAPASPSTAAAASSPTPSNGDAPPTTDAGTPLSPTPRLGSAGSGEGGRPRSFVDRLRATAADMTATAGMDPATLAQSSYFCLEDELLGAAQNPQQCIRKLLRMCEILQAERDSALDAVAGRGNAPVTAKHVEELTGTLELLAAENKRLRKENANLYVLLEENKALTGEHGSGHCGGWRIVPPAAKSDECVVADCLSFHTEHCPGVKPCLAGAADRAYLFVLAIPSHLMAITRIQVQQATEGTTIGTSADLSWLTMDFIGTAISSVTFEFRPDLLPTT
eukprot:jgi/Mesvir1/15925/Mv08249-RA.1